MEAMFSNFGFFHVTEKILKHLDSKSLYHLSMVSQSLAISIRNPKIWWGKFQDHFVSSLENTKSQNCIEMWKKLIERTIENSELQECLANVMMLKLNSEYFETLKKKIDTLRFYYKFDAKNPLTLSVVFNQIPLAKYFLSERNLKDVMGYLELLEIAFLTGGSIQLIKYLIFNCKKHQLISTFGNSMLNFAAYHGNIEAFEILLQLGLNPKKAHINIVNQQLGLIFARQLTPMEIAVIRGNADIVKRLISIQDSKMFEFLILSAIENDRPEIVKILYPFGKPLAIAGSTRFDKCLYRDRWSHHASILGKVDTLKMLISLGDLPFSKEGHDEKVLLLHFVTRKGLNKILEILIDCCSDPNARDRSGYTLLHTATTYRQLNCVEILLKLGANVNIKDNYGNAPIHIAINSRYKDIVSRLAPHWAAH